MKHINPSFVLIILLSIIANTAFAQNELTATPEKNITVNTQSVSNEEASKKLDEIKKNINTSKRELSNSLNETSILEQRLGDITDEITTLEGQLKNIDEQYEKTQQRIVIISDSILKNEQKLEALLNEIAILVRKIENQKIKFKNLITLIFIQSDQVGFFDKTDLQTIKLLLSNESVTPMLEKVDNLSLLELALGDLLKELGISVGKLEKDKIEVEKATEELKELQKNLEKEKLFLILQKESKEKILAATQGEEKIYEELLKQARQEQISIKREVLDLLSVYSKYQSLFGKNGFGTDVFDSTDVLSWPISPSLGISAYFRDPSYKRALGFTHNAIDIRAPQGSEVYAAADGVVLKTKGGDGTDYHYIVLGHNQEVMTLYGHMFEIFVEPGQSVRRGDIIGLSGGLPGSRGAGWLTTGPHLHFEVFKNGSHTDPMDFLDISLLPDKYRK